MKSFLSYFRNTEDGAVTVDWVVLTAAIAGMGLLIALAVKPSIISKSNDITTTMAKTSLEP